MRRSERGTPPSRSCCATCATVRVCRALSPACSSLL